MPTPVPPRKRLRHTLLLVFGYILSPLSWWNDLVVNLPLAYLFAWPASLLRAEWFLPAFVLGYWLTNLGGLYLLHLGARGLLRGKARPATLRRDLLWALLYTLLMVVLVESGLIPTPAELLHMVGRD